MHKNSTKFVKFNPHGCIACGLCAEACPRQVIGMVRFLWHRHAVITRPDACVGCNKCVGICPRHRFMPSSRPL